MNTINKQLPPFTNRLYLTDGGLETTLVYHEGIDLPCFAAFHLLRNAKGTDLLRRYYRTYAEIAVRHGVGFVLEAPTWRANPDWAEKLGYSREALIRANQDAIGLMHEIREEFESPSTPMIISGCVGPRGDGYEPSSLMEPKEAADYHSLQVQTFANSGVDLVTAITMTHSAEAAGVTLAASQAGIPAVISFTLETDGRLPSGEHLGQSIEAVDAAVPVPPAYYMINCAHPVHFAETLRAGGGWLRRIRGLRANASQCSHAELDTATELDAGDPSDLARRHSDLLELLPDLIVLGGCCGTDHRHVEAICATCTPKLKASAA